MSHWSSTIRFSIVTIIFLVTHNAMGQPTPSVYTTEAPASCHTALGIWVNKVMDRINECNAAWNNDQVDRMRVPKKPWKLPSMNCIIKCATIKIGLLAEDGSISETTAVDFVEEHVQERFKDLAMEILGYCFINHGKVDITEKDCKSYSGIFKCISSSAPRIRKACYGF